MWNSATAAIGLLCLSAGCTGAPSSIWWAPAQGRQVDVTQYASNKIDYDFRFASGRGVAASGDLSDPRTAIIQQCYEMDASKRDLTNLGVACTDWPERREVVLSLLALGYLQIEQDCFDDVCDGKSVVNPSDLGISSVEVAKWAEDWPEYIGHGPVYD